MLTHTFNHRIQEAAGSLSSRTAWSTEWVPGHLGLHKDILAWKVKKKKGRNNEWKEEEETKPDVACEWWYSVLIDATLGITPSTANPDSSSCGCPTACESVKCHSICLPQNRTDVANSVSPRFYHLHQLPKLSDLQLFISEGFHQHQECSTLNSISPLLRKQA